MDRPDALMCTDCGFDFGTPDERRQNPRALVIIYADFGTPDEAVLCGRCFRVRSGIDGVVITRDTDAPVVHVPAGEPMVAQLSLWE